MVWLTNQTRFMNNITTTICRDFRVVFSRHAWGGWNALSAGRD